MKNFLLIFLFLISLSSTATARTMEPSLEERVSDCNVDFGSGNSNRDSINAIRNCILEKSEMTKSIHNQNNQRVIEANEEIVGSQLPIFRGLLVFSVFVTVILSGLGFGIWQKSKSDASEGVLQGLLATFVATGVLAGLGWISVIVSTLGQYRLTEFSTQLISASKILADNETVKKSVIESNMSEISALTSSFTTNVIKSEVCATGYVQNYVTANYPYDFKSFDINSDDELLSCIDKEKTNFGTFADVGRTALNHAVKICSNKIEDLDYDCGKMVFAENAPSILKAKFDAMSMTIDETVNSYSEVLCTEYAKVQVHKAEGICSEWNGAEFTLKNSTLHKNDVDKLLIQQVSVLNKEIIDGLAESVENKDNLSDVYLFSYMDQMYSLFFSDFDETRVLTETSEHLKSISFREPKVTLLHNGYESNPLKPNNSMYVDGLADFNHMLLNSVDKIMSSDAISYEANKTFLSILYDPKELVGSYYGKKYMSDRCTEKGCYEFDVLAFKKLVQNTPELLYTLVGVKYSAAFVELMGDTRSKMLAMKVSGFTKWLIIGLLAINLYVLVKFIFGGALSFFIDLIRRNLTLIASAVVIYATKRDIDSLKYKCIEFYYSFLILTNLLISILLTHLLLSVTYDYISEYRLQQSVLNNSVVDYGFSIVWVLVFLISFIVILDFVCRVVDGFVAQRITKLGNEEELSNTNFQSVKANVSKSM
ncbi:hypothetical protein ACRZ5S_19640 [Vibrio scophthalmi]|uniref:hypothetical protein n=1 Tax=Vibrio scophthalmi TaxID=45658 RepID=UPI003EBFF0C2